MGEEGWIALPTDDRHEDVVDGREQQWVEYQPRLAKERRGVGATHGGFAHLGREGPPVPQLAEVGNQRRQAGAMGSVVVVDRLELWPDPVHTACRRHRDMAFPLSMALISRTFN
jgi:hypothetical protein